MGADREEREGEQGGGRGEGVVERKKERERGGGTQGGGERTPQIWSEQMSEG